MSDERAPIEIETIDRVLVEIKVLYQDGYAYVDEYIEGEFSKTLAKYVVADG